MKKYLLILLPAFMLVLFTASCKKDDPQPQNTTAQGQWTGTGEYGTTGGNPTYVFTLNFKSNGTVDITGNNNTVIDVATGTWTMVQDTVKAVYTYAGSSASYTLAAKYSTGATVMIGTIGLSPTTSGTGIFTVTKN